MNAPADRMPNDGAPPNGRPASPPSGNAAMRYLFLFVLGLVVGVVGTVMAVRALDARKDHFPESVMHLFSAHMDMLDANVTGNRCAATDTLPQLQALRTLANDIEPAFGDLRDDSRFAGHASDLRAALDRSLASPPIACAGVQAAMKDIGAACKACHRDFRN
jgi:hypothetical protein